LKSGVRHFDPSILMARLPVAAAELDGHRTVLVLVGLVVALGVVDANRPEAVDRHVLDVKLVDSRATVQSASLSEIGWTRTPLVPALHATATKKLSPDFPIPIAESFFVRAGWLTFRSRAVLPKCRCPAKARNDRRSASSITRSYYIDAKIQLEESN
jgi:hypothetical protein